MIATGKRARRETGLNRYECRKARHTRKSDAKVRRAGWTGERKDH